MCPIIRSMEYKDPMATSALPEGEFKRERDAPISRDLSPTTSEESPKKFLILVVDDSADNVAVLSLDLQQQGYRVVTSTNC